jgi:hypothetical protein
VNRDTLDFDFHISAADGKGLVERLGRSGLFAPNAPAELPVWRVGDFRRFLLGRLPDGREEFLEFWLRNHLLTSFEELYARREEGVVGGYQLPFLSLPDLIHSKETERESDWQDVALLEEILDSRNLAGADKPQGAIAALGGLRSRRGFRQAESRGLLQDPNIVGAAIAQAANPVALCYLVPFAPTAPEPLLREIPQMLAQPLRTVVPGSARHLALVEAMRRVYRQQAVTADRVDKERLRHTG